jgi:hypothetical protein
MSERQPELFGIERLYQLYQSGAVNDRGENSDLLQIARAVGSDLSLEEFAWIASQVEELRSSQSKEKESSKQKGAKKVGDRLWKVMEAGIPVLRSNRGYQSKLWDIPEQFKARKASGVHFSPNRDSSGSPVPSAPGVVVPPVPNLSDVLAASSREPDGSISAPPVQTLIAPPVQDYAGPSVQKPMLTRLMDKMQVMMDVVGTVDPTPVTDGINAVASIGRAITDRANAGVHLRNAATSAISMVPVVGDLAKLAKYSSGGTMGAALSAVAGGLGGSGGGGGGVLGSLAGMFGGGGAGGGGAAASAAGAGGMAMVGPIGLAAVAVGVALKDLVDRIRGFSDLMQPPKFTGNQWDDLSESVRKTKTGFDTFAPFAVKWSAFGFAIGFATKQLQGWVDWFKRIDENSNAMLEHNRKISQYSGQMSVAFTQLDAARVRMDIGRSQKMAGVVGGLARSQTEFERAKDDLTTPFSMALVSIQSTLTTLATYGIKLVDLIEPISEIIEWWYGTRNNGQEGRSAIEESIRIQNARMKFDKLQPFKRNGP